MSLEYLESTIGMSFPEKSMLLNLNALEERLVSPHIPFMQIRESPRGRQLSIHGNVVNVPTHVYTMVSLIPRPINESQTDLLVYMNLDYTQELMNYTKVDHNMCKHILVPVLP